MKTLNKYFFLMLLACGLLITACVDNEFDEPENTFMIPDDKVISISEVLDLLIDEPVLLTDDLLGGDEVYVKGGITADDESGNLFKIVVFQDETAALSVIPDRNELNAEFRAGKTLYLKLNGLTLASNNGLPQIGYGLDGDFLERIPDILVNDFLFASEEESTITPTKTTIGNILGNPSEFYNKLIELEDVEFSSAFVMETFAITNAGDPNSQPESVNALISDCSNNAIIVRNSGFSSFASELVPAGNGKITAIMGRFGSDLQLFIRDLSDLELSNPRCIDNIQEESIIECGELVALASDQPKILNEELLGVSPAFVRATVVADDESGTFFRTLIIQDNTGGLQITIDDAGIFEFYPIGTEVLLSLNGLTLQNLNNNPSIGDGQDDGDLARISELKYKNVLIKTGVITEFQPPVITIEDYIMNRNKYINTLVKFESVEFPDFEIGVPFATESRNIDLTDCDDKEIILRTSRFADFANDPIPSGSGEGTFICGVFNDDLQVYLRNDEDLNFGSERCDGSGNQADNEITIQSLQDRFYNSGADAAQEGFIKGVVISDRNVGQVNNQNIFIQNGEDGIVVRFTGEHNFNIGTELQITVTDRELSQFRGLLQVNNVPLFNAIILGNASLPEPKELSVAEILADNDTYESTRVLVKGATLSGGNTWGGSINVDDGTGDISIFTFNEASYANDPVPSGSVDVIGIVSQFDDNVQLTLNGSGDVTQSGIDPPPGDDPVNQDFQNLVDDEPIEIDGWLNIATKGDLRWYAASFEGAGYAECQAFQDPNPETEAWLITPVIDTDDKSIFSFETAQAFYRHDGLTIWISPEFENFDDAVWTQITDATLAGEDDEFFALVPSGDLDLKDYLGGKVRVGFKYEGTSAENTTRFRIDNTLLK